MPLAIFAYSHCLRRAISPSLIGSLIACAIFASGCGLTKSRVATEQLVISDAVDRAVAMMDFTDLSQKNVYLDTKFVKAPGNGYANADYALSSIRQQMFAYDVRLQDDIEDADYVVEMRIGALGNDGQEVTFGIPSTSLSAGSALVGSPVPLPASSPEISVGRRNYQTGAAKIGMFAYHRASGRPVWQNGVSTATSNARDLYILGWGPIQRGKLYEKPVESSTLFGWGEKTKLSPADEALSQYRGISRFKIDERDTSEGLTPIAPVTHLEELPEER